MTSTSDLNDVRRSRDMIQTYDLHAIRKRLGLSQEKLAEKLGVSRNTISRWERGNFNPTAEKLAVLNRLLAELEGSAAPEEAQSAPPEPPVYQAPPEPGPVLPEPVPAHRGRDLWAICALAISAMISAAMMIAVCVGLYLTNVKLDRLLAEYHVIPSEKAADRGVEASQAVPVTKQPSRPSWGLPQREVDTDETKEIIDHIAVLLEESDGVAVEITVDVGNVKSVDVFKFFERMVYHHEENHYEENPYPAAGAGHVCGAGCSGACRSGACPP